MWDYLQYFGLACIPAFISLDLVYRARTYRAPKLWRLIGLVVTVVAVGVSMAVAAFWGSVFNGAGLLDSRGLGTVGGAIAGIVAYEFLHYGYHRLAHAWQPLWRFGHQMHHATESLDAFSAYYLHPVDAFFFTTWSSLVFFPLLGVSVEAGVLGAAFLGFNAMFQHANMRTPKWLGYLIQRPESHVIHHRRGHHRNNYADLPVIDMLFGTFEHPESVDGIETGFRLGDSLKLIRMLSFRDVSSSPPERPETRDFQAAA